MTNPTRRLQEIMEELHVLADEALDLTRSNPMTHARAKAYWHPAIVMAIDSGHDYMGSCGATIEDAVAELLESEPDEEEE